MVSLNDRNTLTLVMILNKIYKKEKKKFIILGIKPNYKTFANFLRFFPIFFFHFDYIHNKDNVLSFFYNLISFAKRYMFFSNELKISGVKS